MNSAAVCIIHLDRGGYRHRCLDVEPKSGHREGKAKIVDIDGLLRPSTHQNRAVSSQTGSSELSEWSIFATRTGFVAYLRDVVPLSPQPSTTRMAELSLVGCGLKNLGDVLGHMEPATPIEGIRSLVVHGNDLDTLEIFHLQGSVAIGDEDSSEATDGQLHFLDTVRFPGLVSLNASSNNIEKIDGRSLSESFPRLENLDVAANAIEDVENLQACSHLSVLNLAFNDITSLAFLEGSASTGGGVNGSSAASPSGSACWSSRLKKLDCRDCSISSLSELGYLRHCTSLEELRLCNTALHRPSPASSSSASSSPSPAPSVRVERTHANPACNRPGYLALVLAALPSLKRLDDVPVDTWRQQLLQFQAPPHQPQTPQPSTAPAAAPSSSSLSASAPRPAVRGSMPADGNASTVAAAAEESFSGLTPLLPPPAPPATPAGFASSAVSSLAASAPGTPVSVNRGGGARGVAGAGVLSLDNSVASTSTSSSSLLFTDEASQEANQANSAAASIMPVPLPLFPFPKSAVTAATSAAAPPSHSASAPPPAAVPMPVPVPVTPLIDAATRRFLKRFGYEPLELGPKEAAKGGSGGGENRDPGRERKDRKETKEEQKEKNGGEGTAAVINANPWASSSSNASSSSSAGAGTEARLQGLEKTLQSLVRQKKEREKTTSRRRGSAASLASESNGRMLEENGATNEEDDGDDHDDDDDSDEQRGDGEGSASGAAASTPTPTPSSLLEVVGTAVTVAPAVAVSAPATTTAASFPSVLPPSSSSSSSSSAAASGSSGVATTLANLRIENSNLRRQLAEVKKAAESAKDKAASATASDEKKQQQAQEQQERRIAEALKEAEAKFKKSQEEEAATHKAALTELQDKLAALTTSLGTANTELSALRPLATQAAGQAALIESLKTQLAEAEDKLLHAVSPLQAASLKRAVEELSKDKGALEQGVEEAKRAAKRWEQRCQEAEIELGNATREKDALLAEARNAKADAELTRQSLVKERDASLRFAEAARQAQESLTGNISSLAIRAKEAETSAAHAKQQLEEAALSESRAKEALSATREEVDYWKRRCKELEQSSSEDVAKERAKSSQAVAALEEALNLAKAAAEEEMLRLSEEAGNKLTLARQALVAANSKAKDAAASEANAVSKLESLQRQHDTLRHEHRLLEERCKALRGAVDKAEADRVEALAGLSQREGDRISTIQKQVDDQLGQLRHAQEEASVKAAECSSLQRQLQQLHSDLRVKDAMLEDKNETIRSLKRNLLAKSEDFAAAERGLQDAVADLTREVNGLQRQNEVLAAAREEALNESQRAQAEATACRKVASHLETLVQQLRSESGATEELRQQLAAKEAALAFVEREMTGIKQAYDNRCATIIREKEEALAALAKERAAELEATKRELSTSHREAATALEKEIASLRASLQSSEKAKAELAAKVSSTEAEMRVLLSQLDAVKQRQKQAMAQMMQQMAILANGGGDNALPVTSLLPPAGGPSSSSSSSYPVLALDTSNASNMST